MPLSGYRYKVGISFDYAFCSKLGHKHEQSLLSLSLPCKFNTLGNTVNHTC